VKEEGNETSSDQAAAWSDLSEHVRRYGRRGAAPKSLQTVVNRLLARRGYNQGHSENSLAEGWRGVVPPELAGCSRVKKLSRGVLEVVVDNPVVLQKLTFLKGQLLAELQQKSAEKKIKQIRFRLS
jgi:predicted nucleic acid-binding Zn ribbon protein